MGVEWECGGRGVGLGQGQGCIGVGVLWSGAVVGVFCVSSVIIACS